MADHPDKIGKYDVTGVAGKGAMGIVYIAHDPFVDRKVAIKVSTHEEMTPQQRKMFFNEAQSAGALDHPNILRVFDAGEADDQPYIVTEFVESARTLRDFCQPDTRLPVKQVVQYIRQCALALDYAHKRGVTHRDIKPANLMLTQDGTVKIVDFGIAQRAQSDQTQVLGWFGSPLYMSPEQAADQPVTPQSDLFSLGVVAYELIAGKTPFAAKGISTLINNILHADPEPFSAVRDDLPPSLWAVVAHCLAKTIAERYKTGAEIAADLDRVLADLDNPFATLTEAQKLGAARSLAFFKDFSEAEVKEIVRASRWESHQPGTIVIDENSQSGSIYFIVSGDASVRRTGKELATISQGECFGEMGYLADGRRTASVVAVSPLSVMRVDAPLKDWASLPTQLRMNRALQRVLIDRLAATTRTLAKHL